MKTSALEHDVIREWHSDVISCFLIGIIIESVDVFGTKHIKMLHLVKRPNRWRLWGKDR